jgi:kinesin family member C1
MITRSDMNTLKIGNKQISNTTGEEKKEEYEFNFDKVFGPTCSQEYLFHEVAEFVQSALDGYHVCLFSYGQTGSGKVTL